MGLVSFTSFEALDGFKIPLETVMIFVSYLKFLVNNGPLLLLMAACAITYEVLQLLFRGNYKYELYCMNLKCDVFSVHTL